MTYTTSTSHPPFDPPARPNQDLGEILYPKVYQIEPTNARKLVGMLLDLPRYKIDEILNSTLLLRQFVDYGLDVIYPQRNTEGARSPINIFTEDIMSRTNVKPDQNAVKILDHSPVDLTIPNTQAQQCPELNFPTIPMPLAVSNAMHYGMNINPIATVPPSHYQPQFNYGQPTHGQSTFTPHFTFNQ